MKAMILCAGNGTRLQPMTLKTPKPLIPVLGQPILNYILQHLINFGVSDVAINSSVMSNKFSNLIRKNRFDEELKHVNFFHSFEGDRIDGIANGKPLGSAGGIKKIQDDFEIFDDDFIVVCGDAIVDIDYHKMMNFHKSHGGMATIATLNIPLHEVENYGVIVSDFHGKISSFQEKPKTQEALSTQANTGVYIFNPKILNYVNDLGACDIAKDLFPNAMKDKHDIYAYEDEFNWIDFGKLSDYAPGCFSLLHGLMENIKPKGFEIEKNIFVGENVKIKQALAMISGPVFIGDNTIIKPGAVIEGPAIIGNNCIVEAGTYISHSIISNHKHVFPGAFLSERVFFDEWNIKNNDWVWSDEDDKFSRYVGRVEKLDEPMLLANNF